MFERGKDERAGRPQVRRRVEFLLIAFPVQPCKLHFSHSTPAINDEHFFEHRDATNGIARRGVLGGGKS